DGNTTATDGCSATCNIEPGFSCTGTPSVCTPNCGDGVVAGSETCDDGNTAAGDGCSASCALEPGWSCQMTTCDEVCGDGMIVGAEACDDGGTVDGDGCSATCTVEMPPGSPDSGCCSAGGNPTGSFALTLFTLGIVLRRRRRA
ncbi:MAG TPA: DUF4215 domain-containing protein, partial [Kofleriaceae bacterium]|nr:DUF4215 domain-containing protein [Kofleriaceae bacterium]